MPPAPTSLGAVLGALFFGWLTDRLGRKKLFFTTLAVYLVATAATALAWDFWSFLLFRFLTGAGIGGEYAAINSTIQELIPARVRGWTDLVINGSFWAGAAIGAAGAIVLLDPSLLPPDMGWRAAFAIGAALGAIVLLMRAWLPESPRWLVTHGRAGEAEAIVAAIEERFRRARPRPRARPLPHIRLEARTHTPLREVATTLLVHQRRRSLVGLALMASQAFFYNAIFFTYALVLTDFYAVPPDARGLVHPSLRGRQRAGPHCARPPVRLDRPPPHDCLHLCRLGPPPCPHWRPLCRRSRLLLQPRDRLVGHLLLRLGRRQLRLPDRQRDLPLEIRALAIAVFYAVGTGIGGVLGPLLLGALISTGSRLSVFGGYLLGAVLMLAAAVVMVRWGIPAERRPLEDVARPLAARD